MIPTPRPQCVEPLKTIAAKTQGSEIRVVFLIRHRADNPQS